MNELNEHERRVVTEAADRIERLRAALQGIVDGDWIDDGPHGNCRGPSGIAALRALEKEDSMSDLITRSHLAELQAIMQALEPIVGAHEDPSPSQMVERAVSRIKALEAEDKRLREALGRLSTMGSVNCRSIARAALKEDSRE